jgi:3D (Asp-Asp-Asp) domain-containing protein
MTNIPFIILMFLPQSLGLMTSLPEYQPVIKTVEDIVMTHEIVTLTIYSPAINETDSTPNITASGFKIDLEDPSKHNIIAVSRDLKRKWKFNQKVKIEKAGKYNGVYTVKDVMNKRHRKRIDILVGPDEAPIKLKGVKVTAL